MNKPFKTLSTAALAAVFAASAIVPVASAATNSQQAVTTLDSVIISLNDQNVKLSLEAYADLLDAGKIQISQVTHVQTANGNNFTLEQYSDYLDIAKDVDLAAGQLEDNGTKQDVSDVKEGSIVDGEIVVGPVVESFEVTDIAAINETSIELSFPSDSAIEESDLKGKEITLTGGNEQTLTATYVDGSLADGKADFLLSGDSKLVSDTTYTVSADWATFENGKFTFTVIEEGNQEQADAVTDLINLIPEDEFNKELLENGAEVLAAKQAFDALSDASKELVASEDKALLDSKVKDFKSLTKAEISGVVVAVTKADTLQKKQAIVADAEAHLATAYMLGMEQAEYDYNLAIIKEALKLVVGEQNEVDAAVNAANVALKALPAVDDVTAENLEAVKVQVEEAKDLVAVAKALDDKVSFDTYTIEQLDAKIAELVKANQDAIDEAVKAAQDAINELPAKEDINADNYVDVQKDIKAAEDLLKTAQALDESVTFDTYPLDQAKEKVAEVIASIQGPIDDAVKAAQDAINALPNAEELTLDGVPAAKTAIADALALVDTALKLDENVTFDTYPMELLEAKIAELEANQTAKEKAIDAAVEAISLIGNPADFTLETLENDHAKVKNATDKLKEATDLGAKPMDIVNYDHYELATAKIIELEGDLEAKDQAILDAKTALTNLPIKKSINFKNENKVVDARTALDAATAYDGVEEADFVNLWKLTDAEAKIADLKTLANGNVKTPAQLAEVDGAVAITLHADFKATEDVTIDSDVLETLVLNGTFEKDLYVNAPKAAVTNNAEVKGNIYIGEEVQTFARMLAASTTGVASWTENSNVPNTITVGANSTVETLTLSQPTTLNVAEGATFTNPVEVNAESTIVSKTPVKAKVASGVTVTVKENADDENGVEIEGTDSDNPVDVVALAAAIDATTSLEALVDTAAKAEELVTDKEKRQAVSNAFLKASNKIQSVTGDAKTELMNRANAANDIAIAASFVDSLQTASKNLTLDNLPTAKIDLTKAEGNVSSLPDGDIKDAFSTLVQAEAKQINEVSEAVEAVEKAEETKTQADADTAGVLIDALKGSQAKIALQARLDVVQSGINQILADAIGAAEEAIKALPTIEDATVEDEDLVNTAKDAVAAVKALDEDVTVEGEEVIADLEAKIADLKQVAADIASAKAGKAAVEALNLVWDTDAATTLAAVNTALEDIDGATAAIVDGDVVVTITFGEATETVTISAPVAPEKTDAEKAAESKAAVEALNLVWDTDADTTLAAVNTALENIDGATAAIVDGDVVVTITFGEATETVTISAPPAPVTYTFGEGATAETLVLTFSEAVTGAEAVEISDVTGGTIAVTEEGKKLTITATETTVKFTIKVNGEDVEVTLTLAEGTWTLTTVDDVLESKTTTVTPQ